MPTMPEDNAEQLPAQIQQMQAQFTEMAKYHLVLDSGYPELRYCADGDDEGTFVAHLDTGDSLTEILKKATEHMLGTL